MVDIGDGGPVICIFGSYSASGADGLYKQAYEIGYGLAKAGYVVCNGGYGGTMEASAKGAKDAGGSTIGVTCTIFRDKGGGPLQVNSYIDREVPYGDLFSRIDAMMRMSAGYVVLAGGTGTLSEFSIVWEFVCKKMIEPRPIFLVGDYFKPVVDRILAERPRYGQHLYCVECAEEILLQVAGLIPIERE
ncbi:MAG: LOG family protein [Planctomycetota bacterium]|jgi:uncharacterized protein (TIGR00725 family)